jgi:toxin-antitoxin system PIN domain toxin
VRLLLDVNVWVALFDDSHIHNADALRLVAQPGLQIATCALTENGVLRVLNLPGYARRTPPGFQAVREKLALVCAEVDHEFWTCDVSLRDGAVLQWQRIMGHNQITDAYLLALAVRHGGALATFDHRVTASAVTGATAQHLRHL